MMEPRLLRTMKLSLMETRTHRMKSLSKKSQSEHNEWKQSLTASRAETAS